MGRTPAASQAGPLLRLAGGDLRLDDAELLLDLSFDSTSLPDGWRVETGTWTPTPEGLVGSIDDDSAAVIWCGASFPDELALVLQAEAMPGHDSDANAFFRGTGRIYGDGPRGAWIAGTAGWYVHDHGLERHPHGPTFRVSGEALVPGRVVRIAAGHHRGRVFLWKDGRLLLERDDPGGGEAAPHDRLGLGTWNSCIRFRHLCVYALGGTRRGGAP